MGTIKIHRGANQIGGVVTELQRDGHRILIDFGANLPGTADAKISDEELVQNVFGKEGEPFKTDAVLFTHYHGDHVGLKNRIPKEIPMYVGQTAKEIMTLIAKRVDFTKERSGRSDEIEMPVIERMLLYWKLGTKKEFNGIKVTPLVCDHSALDAYMFMIEMDGKRILYTGDFRAHGVSGKMTFEKMISRYVGKVDILVTEGTMVSRTDEEDNNSVKTEKDLGVKAGEIFRAHKENVVLVSSTNLDSVMQFYLATPNDKVFLCDPYQAEVMKIAIKARKKYFPHTYKYKKTIYVLCPGENETYMKNLRSIRNPVTGKRCFMMADPDIYLDKGFVMLARPNWNPNVEIGRFEERMQLMKDPFITYSMWDGYLKGGKAQDPAIVNFIGDRTDKAHMTKLHTSGHAYVEILKKLMDMTQPEVIIPMHTESAKAFEEAEAFWEYQGRIHLLKDGESYKI